MGGSSGCLFCSDHALLLFCAGTKVTKKPLRAVERLATASTWISAKNTK
jgi:hypothetical protein